MALRGKSPLTDTEYNSGKTSREKKRRLAAPKISAMVFGQYRGKSTTENNFVAMAPPQGRRGFSSIKKRQII